MTKKSFLLILSVAVLTLAAGCSIEDRAKIVCSSLYDTESLLMDCHAGIGIANASAIDYAREHRLLGVVIGSPDSTEVLAARNAAEMKCESRAEVRDERTGERPSIVACSAGIEAYVNYLRQYNSYFGQGRP